MIKEKTWLYSFARVVIGIIYRWIFRAKARGVEHFPTEENSIILGNHISAWDPLTVAVYYKASEIHFFAKDSLFRSRFLRWLLTKLHAIPVRRGETDMGAMRQAMQVLKEGRVLGIFPEGTRHSTDQVQSIETGVAVMALKSSVPIIPVLISGRYKLFGRVRLVVGPPIPMDDLRAGRPDTPALEAAKARMIVAVEALRPLADF